MLRIGRRFLRPYHGEGAQPTTSQNPTAGTVLLHLIEVPEDCYVDAIIITHGASPTGNATVGIYGPITSTEDTCQGLPVIVQSASTALVNANTSQIISITETFLRKGRYYIAVEFDNAGHTYMRHGNQQFVVGWVQTYARSGGYGALTDPCPTITNTGNGGAGVVLRVSK
jgi:hypothetical protein